MRAPADPTQVLYANLMGSVVVVVWALLWLFLGAEAAFGVAQLVPWSRYRREIEPRMGACR